jgi:hypothetical protein
MSTDKIPNDHPVTATEGQPATPQPIQRYIGGFGPTPEQARAWREAAIKRRLEREAASGATANNADSDANNSTEPTAKLGAGHSDDQANKNVRVTQ